MTMENGHRWTIAQLRNLRESEDKVEFKKGEGGNIAYDGGSRIEPAKRRRCILGYVIALCNENGGWLVIGMEDRPPHNVVGTRQCENAIGELESNIYRDTGIRPDVYELYEDESSKTGRVLVIAVPPRPIGKVYKFEDVPLMRVGEDLRPMSDAYYCKIIQEQEPDFSQQICDGVGIDDLDDAAISVMREKYARKQNNEKFLTLDKEQILTDLDLVVDGKVTNGAVILVGKEQVLKRIIPQASVRLEYRANEAQITFDNRTIYAKPFFLMIDEVWHDINLHNGNFPVNEGSYIFNVPYFNEEVIREAVNNAIAHRDYRRASEVVIKLYRQKMTVINPGGLPHGVTLANILTVPSTPRNRLLADVLSKTGIVERSGQGVDKIFYDTLSEGKSEPDYSNTDDFKVELTLLATVRDAGFALFIESVQKILPDDQKLSVFEIMTLAKIRDGAPTASLDKKAIHKLLDRKLIEKIGRTSGTAYILCRSYFELSGDPAEYMRRADWDFEQMLSMVVSLFAKFKEARMGDFVKLLDGHLTRRQIRAGIQKLVAQKVLTASGVGAGTRYSLSESFKVESEMINEALRIGITEIAKRNCPKSGQDEDENGVHTAASEM